MKIHRQKIGTSVAAFTLLEMIVAMSAFIILIGGIFALVGGTVELMEEMEESRNQDAVRTRFIETMRINLEELPRGTKLEFDFVKRGKNHDTYLSLVNAPNAFDFGINSRDEIERVMIAAEIQSGGFIRCGIYYLVADEFTEAKKSEFVEMNKYPYVEIIPRMRQLTWQFYSTKDEKWKSAIDKKSKSSLTKLTLRFEGETTATQSVFWHLPSGA